MGHQQNKDHWQSHDQLALRFVFLPAAVYTTMKTLVKQLGLALCLLAVIPAVAQNRSLDFDGFFSHVVVPDDDRLDLSGSFTIEVRFDQGAGVSDYRTLIDHRDPVTNESNFTLQVYDGTDATVYMNDGTDLGFLFNDNLQVGWNMFSIVLDGSTLYSYLNGNAESQALTGSPSAIISEDMFIGCGASGLELFDGRIDEIRIWDHARCAALINAYSNTELTGEEPGLVAWYNLNQGTANYQNPSETTLDDSSGNNLNGTLNTFVLNGDTSNWSDGDSGVDEEADLSCDDSDATTTNDAYDTDCNCAGEKLGCTNVDACNYNATAVVNDGTCTYPGCADALACNFDPDTGCADAGLCDYSGSCALNSTPDQGEVPTVHDLGNCSFDAGTLVGGDSDGSGADTDVWYTITPTSRAIRVEMRTTAFDAMLGLFDEDFNLVASSDRIVGLGSEVLNIGGLEIGDTYHLAIGSTGAIGSGLFDYCVQEIEGTTCDSDYGPHAFTGTFKANYVGANGYNFHFTSTSSGVTYSTGVQAGTICNLRYITGIQPGFDYTVEIDAEYDLGDGIGGFETITVGAPTSCTMAIEAPAPSTMRAADNCTNHGAHNFGDYIRSDSYRPAVTDWMWKFTRIDQPEIPITYNRGSSNRLVRLSNVPGLVAGATYHVKVRPIYEVFYQDYGDRECLEMISTALRDQDFEEDELDAFDFNNNGEFLQGTGPSLELYPNPTSGDRVTITGERISGRKVTVSVRNAAGELIKEMSLTNSAGLIQTSLDTQNLAPGMYLVELRDQSGRTTEKLIVR